MSDKAEHLNKKQKVGITIGTTVGGILIIAAIVLALLFGCKPKKEPTYTITWKNYNGEVLETDLNVKKGEMPSYDGETPIKAETETATYTFTGWSPTVKKVTGDATYKAKFEEVFKPLTVTFPADTDVIYSTNVVENIPYGNIVIVQDNTIDLNGTIVTATMNSTVDTEYTFDHWTISNGELIQSNMTISAIFSAHPRYYNVTFTATNGGMVQLTGSGDPDETIEIPGGKTYEAKVTGDAGSHVVSEVLTMDCTWSDTQFIQCVKAVNVNDGFSETTFVGWYYNGEPLLYEQPLNGDVTLEARFTKGPVDHSGLFVYECDYVAHTCYITGVSSAYALVRPSSLRIPDTYDGCTVIGIKNETLRSFSEVRNLFIPKTIIYIEEILLNPTFPLQIDMIRIEEGNPSFKWVDGVVFNNDMTQLVIATYEMHNYSGDRYTVPSTVNYLWAHCFHGMNLKRIDIPEGIEFLSQGCFYGNYLDEGFTFPSSVKRIEHSVFSYCDMTEIHIPDTVEYIGDFVFFCCSALKNIYIGSGVKEIADTAFIFASGLLSIEISSDNLDYASYNGYLCSKDLTTLLRCPSGLEELPPFPSSLKTIETSSFRSHASSIIEIPEGVENIHAAAFAESTNLTEIKFPSTIKTIASGAFAFCHNVKTIRFGGTVEEWEAVIKEDYWYKDTIAEVVNCSDGDVTITRT